MERNRLGELFGQTFHKFLMSLTFDLRINTFVLLSRTKDLVALASDSAFLVKRLTTFASLLSAEKTRRGSIRHAEMTLEELIAGSTRKNSLSCSRSVTSFPEQTKSELLSFWMLATSSTSQSKRDVLRNKVVSKKSVPDLLSFETDGERNVIPVQR